MEKAVLTGGLFLCPPARHHDPLSEGMRPMPKIDIANVKKREGSLYPAPFHEKMHGRIRQALGDAGGLNQFGVNLMTLAPGNWSSQRHWHTEEDEFIWVLAGEVVLISDGGRTTLRAGDCAAFPRNVADGHHLVNESDAPAQVLEVGTRSNADTCTYSDIDMVVNNADDIYRRRDGTPYVQRHR
jgi:uncharacterized cupin superfamily protein